MARKSWDVVFECDAQAVGKMRNEVQVSMQTPATEEVLVVTDEMPVHGGDGTAPSPLALFTGALAGCLMTQIRVFAKRLKVDIGDLQVKGRTHWRAHMDPGQPYVTEPIEFELQIDVNGEATDAELKDLIAHAKKGCFIEQTLRQKNDIVHRLRTPNGVFDV